MWYKGVVGNDYCYLSDTHTHTRTIWNSLHWPLATSDGEMPLRSWRGKALSLGMSSGTRARGCPSTTDAARHTCLMRGPPALRNSWHKGEMTCGWEQMQVISENRMQKIQLRRGDVLEIVKKFNRNSTQNDVVAFLNQRDLQQHIYLFCAYLYLRRFHFNWHLSFKLSP